MVLYFWHLSSFQSYLQAWQTRWSHNLLTSYNSVLKKKKSTYGHKNGFGIKPDSAEIQSTEKSEILHIAKYCTLFGNVQLPPFPAEYSLMRTRQLYHSCSGLRVHAPVFVNAFCICTAWENGKWARGWASGAHKWHQKREEAWNGIDFWHEESWDWVLHGQLKEGGTRPHHSFFKHTPPLAYLCPFLNTR